MEDTMPLDTDEKRKRDRGKEREADLDSVLKLMGLLLPLQPVMQLNAAAIHAVFSPNLMHPAPPVCIEAN